jgi:hypothetical protein
MNTVATKPYLMMDVDLADAIRSKLNVGSHVRVMVAPNSYDAPYLRGRAARYTDEQGRTIHHMAAYTKAGGRVYSQPSTEHITLGDRWACDYFGMSINVFEYRCKGVTRGVH